MRYRIIDKIIIFCTICLLTGCQSSLFNVQGAFTSSDMPQNYPADKLYQQGKIALNNNNIIHALQFFKSAYAENPKSLSTLNGLGSVYDQLRRFDLAQNYYYRALQLDPQSKTTLNNLGYSYLLQNKPALAIEYFRKAYGIDPTNPYIQHNLMMAEQELERQNNQIQLTGNFSDKKKLPEVVKSVAMTENVIEKHPQFSVMKLTSKVQRLKRHSSDDFGQVSGIKKQQVGYKLTVIDAEKINENDFAQIKKKIQKVEISNKPIIFSTKDEIIYVSRPLIKETVEPAKVIVEISNGAGRRGMAARLKGYMKTRNIIVDRLTNADHFSHMNSRIFYHPGWENYARVLASQLPISIVIEEVSEQFADVRLEVGGDMLSYDVELINQNRGKK